MSWLTRLANVTRRSRVDRALDEEMQFHIDSRVDDLVAAGMPRDAAESLARRQFGNRLRHRESSRDVKLLPWVESLVTDLRFAVRLLRKHAVVTGAAIASLGLAIGATLAAFSLVDALILRPLPVPDPERLVYLTFPTYSADTPVGQSFSYPMFKALAETAGARIDLFATSFENRRRATFGDDAEDVRVRFVSGNAFPVLGVRPALGRLIDSSDDLMPGRRVAVISHAFWKRRFGSEAAVAGRMLALGQKSYEIVGVTAAGFTGIEPGRLVDVWLPLTQYDASGFSFSNQEWNWFWILGRLQPGADAAAARDVLQAPFRQFRRELMAAKSAQPRDRIERYVAAPLMLVSAANGPSALRRQFDRPLWILSLLVAFVLLIAVSNVANLCLARAAGREREMSVRIAIGAGRARLIQQIFVEGGVLAALASAIGLLFARAAAPTIVQMIAPSADPAYLELPLDARLLVVLGVSAASTTLLFALAPALRASRVAPAGVLGSATSRLTARSGLPRPLVAVQVGFSVAILFVAGLLLLSFARLVSVNLGFAKDGVLLVTIDRRGSQEPDAERAVALQLLERVRSAPGVVDASLSARPLFSQGGWISSVRVAGHEADQTSPAHLPISPGFFRTMGIRFVAGRDFTPADSEAAEPRAVIINEAFVRRYFGNGPAVGRVYDRVGQPPAVPQEVVGVVADIRGTDPRSPASPTVYVPLRGLGRLEVRAAGDPRALVAAVERAVRSTHPALAVTGVSLQSALVSNTLLRERLLALLSGFFAAVGMLLAAVGLYGVLNYSVVLRTREIGIRIALGARAGALIVTVVKDAALMTGIGILAGLAAGLYLSRFVMALLHEVRPTDAVSIALPVGCLIVTALVAAAPAARRASRLNPVEALRVE